MRKHFEGAARLREEGLARPPAPPFRVLSPSGPRTPPSPPPPPRAPEPYKLAPARAHRNTSFAIIAELQSPDPVIIGSRSPSPANLAISSGRSSPFRGRGFKAPAQPRARSRPQSPDAAERRRKARGDKRVSLSQQSSPKRTPLQPNSNNTSNRLSSQANNNNNKALISDKKPDPRRPSPKFGRRAANRYAPSIASGKPTAGRRTSTNQPAGNGLANGNLKNRSQHLQVAAKVNSRRPLGQQQSRVVNPPVKQPPGGKRFVTVQPANNNNNNNNKTGQQQKGPASNGGARVNRAASIEALGSPSKIPLRRGSIANGSKSTSLQSLAKASPEPTTPTALGGPAAASEASTATSTALVDLLREASGGATGTSSVVSTTTTTAAKPLQIDAGPILTERELAAKLADLESSQQKLDSEDQPPKPAPRNGKQQPQQQQASGQDLVDAVVKNFGPNSPLAERKAQLQQQKPAEPSQDNQKTVSSAEDPGRLESSGSERMVIAVKEKQQPQQQPDPVQYQASSLESLSAGTNSARSTDTGVSVDTVKGGGAAGGLSSARERTGMLSVKRPEAIETLSGNVVSGERNGTANAAQLQQQSSPSAEQQPQEQRKGQGKVLPPGASRWERLRHRLGNPFRALRSHRIHPGAVTKCWPKAGGTMRCLAGRRDAKGGPLAWPGSKSKAGKARQTSKSQLTEEESPGTEAEPSPLLQGRWSRIKQACRCSRIRNARWCQRRPRVVAPSDAPKSCCPPERRPGAVCRRLWARCKCCTRKSEPQRNRSVRAKHSLTSVVAPPLSEENRPKLPDVLIEHNSVMRGAIPCLPVPIAWICLFLNFLLPGSGTILSGLFNLCMGQPRFSATASPAARFGALVVNVLVGFSQCFTILFCLVGWGWSIWWGVTMLKLAKKYKRFKDSEAMANDPEARGAGPETATLPAPGLATANNLATATTIERR